MIEGVFPQWSEPTLAPPLTKAEATLSTCLPLKQFKNHSVSLLPSSLTPLPSPSLSLGSLAFLLVVLACFSAVLASPLGISKPLVSTAYWPEASNYS